MSSQANPARASNSPRVQLSADGELTASATETIQALQDALDIEPAPALAALFASSARSACYIDKPAPSKHQLSAGQLSPNAHRLQRLVPEAVADAATLVGCPTIAWRVWSDEHRTTYTDNARTVQILRVQAPWCCSSIDPAGRTEDEIVKHGHIGSGDYLVASVGTWDRTVSLVGRVHRLPVTGDLEAVPAFRANRVDAECRKCHRSWFALDRDCYFHPASEQALSWHLSEVTEYGLVTSTVPCQIEGCPGRIGFSIASR